MPKSLLIANHYPFVPSAKLANYFQSLAKLGRIVDENNFGFGSVTFQTSEAATRHYRRIVNWQNYRYRGACMTILWRLPKPFTRYRILATVDSRHFIYLPEQIARLATTVRRQPRIAETSYRQIFRGKVCLQFYMPT